MLSVTFAHMGVQIFESDISCISSRGVVFSFNIIEYPMKEYFSHARNFKQAPVDISLMIHIKGKLFYAGESDARKCSLSLLFQRIEVLYKVTGWVDM